MACGGIADDRLGSFSVVSAFVVLSRSNFTAAEQGAIKNVA